MLDTETKRRIDTARDILVGKVPDPKSQVEQITIALIYKFMDDMDAESEELGGKRSFLTGPYARYGWAKLMSPGLGGHEMLGLYGEGISKMPENPGIPPLFRAIFKNAYRKGSVPEYGIQPLQLLAPPGHVPSSAPGIAPHQPQTPPLPNPNTPSRLRPHRFINTPAPAPLPAPPISPHPRTSVPCSPVL